MVVTRRKMRVGMHNNMVRARRNVGFVAGGAVFAERLRRVRRKRAQARLLIPRRLLPVIPATADARARAYALAVDDDPHPCVSELGSVSSSTAAAAAAAADQI